VTGEKFPQKGIVCLVGKLGREGALMKMKAGQIVAARRIEMVEADVPFLEEGQVLVKQRAAAICGSDLPYFLDDRENPMTHGLQAPFRPGMSLHECVGFVAESRSPRFRVVIYTVRVRRRTA
jgi:threonine dehydrogenase-like Zn-dependent dehydrogenase